MAKVLLLNGPNLNLLGTREPEKYGMETLDNVISKARAQCEQKNLQFDHFQSNHEGVMIDRIHQARSDGTSYIVINAGAWTHTSVALIDALSGIDVPFVEVHVGKCVKVIRFASLTVYRTLFLRSPTHTNEKASVITHISVQRLSVRTESINAFLMAHHLSLIRRHSGSRDIVSLYYYTTAFALISTHSLSLHSSYTAAIDFAAHTLQSQKK